MSKWWTITTIFHVEFHKNQCLNENIIINVVFVVNVMVGLPTPHYFSTLVKITKQ